MSMTQICHFVIKAALLGELTLFSLVFSLVHKLSLLIKKDLLVEESSGSLIHVSGIAVQKSGKDPVAVRSAT